MTEISNVVYVCNDGKVMYVTSNAANVWFYRHDGDFIAYNEASEETHSVDRSTVESAVNHDDTTVETMPVSESPFDFS